MPTDWAHARTTLAGATCLWQDLDGLHRRPAPAHAPPTSILWAWWDTPDDRVARLRIDGDRIYLALTRWPTDPLHTIAWGADDNRITAFRPASEDVTVTEQFDTATVDDITYLRPARR